MCSYFCLRAVSNKRGLKEEHPQSSLQLYTLHTKEHTEGGGLAPPASGKSPVDASF